MTPTQELVQYIENEAFAGRRISDILTDVRAAGWHDSLILDAVAQLNEEHQVLEQTDLDPLHRKKVHRHSLLFILFVATVTLLCALVIAGIVREIQKPEYLRFNDPNFSMRLPDDWKPDSNYEAGLRKSTFYSSEYDGEFSVSSEKAAEFMMYAEAEDDEFGKLLREGGSGMSTISDQTVTRQGISYRIIEYRGSDDERPSQFVRGIYAYIQRGQVVMSARIESDENAWEQHAEEAKRILQSITPLCSRKSLSSAEQSEDKVFLCGY